MNLTNVKNWKKTENVVQLSKWTQEEESLTRGHGRENQDDRQRTGFSKALGLGTFDNRFFQNLKKHFLKNSKGKIHRCSEPLDRLNCYIISY